jgi:UDP-N-acetylmuramyl pentapeptide phosphotransferase/UDP-N-acetylglucosamine-1-phosphate transferase
LQLLVAAANFALPRLLHYRENLAKVSPIIRQIFLAHGGYIVLVLIGFGVICLGFPADLCGASPLGKFFSAFLAVFWSSRVVVQFVFYDRAIKKEFPRGNLFFSAVFLYFALTFIAAAVHAYAK